eukprot:TRINITY_DN28492_c0_g1_i1.p1 TRINITY_DN28492_c0_g1~~TRINITY_DN28492_c0_g1_i1.p1  ORF type:complete len:450 (-),score=76.12 TRINITY_DN28492_c0_g1_i1:23-1372(-)
MCIRDRSTAIDSIGVTNTHWLSVLILGGVWVLNGMCVGVTPFFVSMLDDVHHLSHLQDGIISASVLVGYVIGNISIGFLADKFGRKPVLIAGMVWIGGATLCAYGVSSFEGLCVIRFLVGIGVAGTGVTCNTIIAELSPTFARAPMMASLHVFWQVGVFLIVVLHSGLSWRQLLLATAIPAFVTVPLAIIFLPESPRWLSLQPNGYAAMVESMDTLEHGPRFLRSASQLTGTSYGQRVALAAEPAGTGSFLQQAAAVFDPSLKWAVTIPLCVMFFGLNFAAYTNFMWVKQYYDHVDLADQVNHLYSLMAFARVAGCLVATFAVNIVPRRAMLSTSFFVAGLCTALAVQHHQWATPAFTVGALFEEMAWACMYVYAGEVYPSVIRNTATGLVMGPNRVGGVLACLLGRVLMTVSLEFPFYLGAGTFVFTGLVSLCLRKDKAGQTLDDSIS